jgi:hypothetical protein
LIEQTAPEQRQSFIEAQDSITNNEDSTIAGQDAAAVKSILNKLIFF